MIQCHKIKFKLFKIYIKVKNTTLNHCSFKSASETQEMKCFLFFIIGHLYKTPIKY